MKQHFVLLGPLGGLLTKDFITGIPTEPFLGVVHLAWSTFFRRHYFQGFPPSHCLSDI
jgi:hypothetical protein